MRDAGTMLSRTDGAVGTLTFNNPSRRNAVSVDMWRVIPEMLQALEQDPAVRVIVIMGAGDAAFASGADISQFAEHRASAEAISVYETLTREAWDSFERVTKPVVAQIRGYCMGGGLGVALACDLRIAADDARFGIPAARLGVGYEFSGVKKLAELVGPAFAKEIFFTARQFDAREAQAMGLVNRVVPAADLAATVHALATTIAANAPLSVLAAKLAVDTVYLPQSDARLERVRLAIESCARSRDYVEGRTAFMDKREPDFRGG
jgi:enoyl-CoA hydratase/carnithine racemase